MPLTFTPVRNEDTTAATRLLAQYMPNLGEDIYNIGSILSAEEGKAAKRLQTQKTLAELQDKDQQRMDALQFQDWMTRNAEQANALMKDAFGGQYDRIYDVPLPYKIASQLRTLAGTEAKLGNESRESAAKIQENATNAQLHLAKIATEGFNRAKLGFELKEAERKEQQAQGEKVLSDWLIQHPREAEEVFSKYTSDNPENVQEALSHLGEISKLNPFQIKLWTENLKTALPQDQSGILSYQENAKRIADQIQNVADNTNIGTSGLTLGALTRAISEGIPQDGIHIMGKDVTAQELKDMLNRPEILNIIREEMDTILNGSSVIGADKADQVSPLLNANYIKALIPYFLSQDDWTNIFKPEDAIGNGLAIFQHRGFWNKYFHSSTQGGLRKAIQDLNQYLINNRDLVEALNTKTGILSRINPILKNQITKASKRYIPFKKGASSEELRNKALPYILRELSTLRPEFRLQLEKLYREGLIGGQAPLDFSIKMQPSSR